MSEPDDAARGEAPLVMIVDDEPEIVDIVQVVLRHAGYRVVGASNGDECLALATKLQPDLILLDIMMPGLSGWEVLQQLQADPVTRPIPVMMLTALAQDTDILRGLEAGAVEYLVKPFDLMGLLGHVDWVLQQSTADERAGHRQNLIAKLRLAA